MTSRLFQAAQDLHTYYENAMHDPHGSKPWVRLGEVLEEIEAATAADHVGDANEMVESLRAQKDGAYTERDRLVCALSKVFPSHLSRHPDSDESWDDDWRWIVFVNLPTGQASWHIHDSERPWFDHLAVVEGNPWDGHTTEEKYRRVDALKAAMAEAMQEAATAEPGECSLEKRAIAAMLRSKGYGSGFSGVVLKDEHGYFMVNFDRGVVSVKDLSQDGGDA